MHVENQHTRMFRCAFMMNCENSVVTGCFGRIYILITLVIISSTTIGNVCAKPKHYFHFRNPSADDTGTAATLCAFKALFANSNHWMVRFRVSKLLKGKTVIFSVANVYTNRQSPKPQRHLLSLPAVWMWQQLDCRLVSIKMGEGLGCGKQQPFRTRGKEQKTEQCLEQ